MTSTTVWQRTRPSHGKPSEHADLGTVAALARNRETEILVVAGREVAISHPDKVLFPKPEYTKLDVVRYYLAVAEGALRGSGGRPNMLVRYPNCAFRRGARPTRSFRVMRRPRLARQS